MKNIITIQHTESIHHTNGMVGSWTDWDLSELGVKQAHNIGKRLSKEIKDKDYIIYTSDLKRASQTAEIVSSYLDIKPIVRPELRERNLGSTAVGKPVTWMKDNALPFKFDIDHKCLVDAESVREHWGRLLIVYNEIINSKDENIIIFSHGGTLSLFNAMWLKMKVEDLNSINIHGKAGGVSKFVENNEGIHFVKGISDMSYI
ncbi:MAG: putative phosphoserine phosphatase 2 [Candidatus Izimaplasma bacterium HR2]|nr:MAG: putative phosphoserine phosphatase 2 [Candidatus Izimaplasma bacterium HR2]